jgi:LysM repeat protein
MELAIPIGPSAADPSLYAEERPEARRPQRVYKVRKGDTLVAVAVRTGVPVERLRALNEISGDELRPGQRLVLAGHAPSPAAAGTPAPPEGSRVHHVRSGDTLYQLALRYGTTVDRLCRLNRISPGRTLHPGDSLLIPQ